MPVYQYQGQHYELSDGLSPEQALSKIKSHLGQTEQETPKEPGIMDAMKEFGKTALEGLGALPQFGANPVKSEGLKGPVEALAHGISGAGGFMAGLGLSPIAKAFDPSQSIPEHAGRIADNLTYQPKTELGEDLSKPIDEAFYRMQGLVGHGTPDLPQGTHGAELPLPKKAEVPTPGVKGIKTDIGLRTQGKSGIDLGQFASEQQGVAEPGPQLSTNLKGAQGDLFPDTSITEKVGNKDNTVVPGAASQFDPFQEQSAIQPRSANRQMDLPLPDPDMPSVIQQSRAGVGQMLPNDPGFAEAVRRGAPEEARAFDEMQQQLQSGQASGVDFPSGNGIGAMADQLRQQQDRREQQGMYQDLSRQANAQRQQGQAFDQLMGQEGTAGSMRAQEAAKAGGDEMTAMRQMEEQRAAQEQQRAAQEQQAKAASQADAQAAVQRRQAEMEMQVKRQQSLDFGAAERARQEAANVPGMDPMRAHVGEFQQHMEKLEKATKAAEDDSRVKASVDRLDKAEQLYIKAADAMQSGLQKMNEPLLKRLEEDTKFFEQAAEQAKQAAIRELMNPLKESPRPSTEGMNKPESVDPTKPPQKPRKSSPGGKQSGYILMDGKKKEAAQNLVTKLGIDQKLGEFAPSQWTPEEAVKQAKMGKDLDQNILQRIANNFTKGGMYQALKTHNPMIRYVVEKIQAADRRSRAEINDWVHDKLAPAMREMNAKEQGDIWSAIELADLSQKPLDYVALAKAGASEAQLKFAKVHREAMDHAFEQINKAREAAGKEPIDKRTAYAAMRASGDFRRLVYDKPPKDGGTVIGVIGSNFRNRLNGLQEEMKTNGYHVGEERYYGSHVRQTDSANQSFMSAIEHLADNDPRIAQFVDVLDKIRTSEVYSFLNAKKHTMGKKGVFGMEGRKSWQNAEENASDGFKAQIGYMEAAIKWGNLSDASADIKPVMSDPGIKMPLAKEWSQNYLKNALGFNPSKVGSYLEGALSSAFEQTGVGYSVARKGMATARQMTNGLLLMLNPRFWLTNVVQPLQAMPGMKAMLIARGLDAGFDFGTGYSYLAQAANTVMKKNTGLKLEPYERSAMEYARKYHVYGSDMVEHSNSTRKNTGYYAEKVSNFAAGQIESMTRQTAFYSFVHMLKENGMSEKNGLFEAAHNLTDTMMNDYSTINRPQVFNSLGPVGDLAVNLQSYKFNELSRLSLFARHAKEYGSLRPLAAHLGAGVAFGGILGTVAYDEADQAYSAITKMMGKPDSLTNRIFSMSEGLGKKMYDATGGKVDQPYLASHGVFSMAGMDMTRSLGLTEIVPNNVADLVAPGSSKLGEIAGAAGAMATDFSSTNAKRLAHAASPIGMQGAVDRKFFEQPDGLALRPRDLAGQAYRNGTDKALKNFGFSGVNESVQRQKTYNIEKESSSYADIRTSALGAMRDQLFEGDVKSASVQKYLDARGSIKTLQTDLKKYAQQQNMSAQELNTLHAALSRSIASKEKAAEYVRMFSK